MLTSARAHHVLRRSASRYPVQKAGGQLASKGALSTPVTVGSNFDISLNKIRDISSQDSINQRALETMKPTNPESCQRKMAQIPNEHTTRLVAVEYTIMLAAACLSIASRIYPIKKASISKTHSNVRRQQLDSQRLKNIARCRAQRTNLPNSASFLNTVAGVPTI